MITTKSLARRGNDETTQLQRQVAELTDRLRQVPSTFVAPVNASVLWRVIGGNILLTLGCIGINRRADAVAGSEMPAGTGGSSGDIISMPASSTVPVGLPNGVGIAQSVADGSFAWIVLDATNDPATPSTNLSVPSLVLNELLTLLPSTRILDKVVGGVTYRYSCRVPAPGTW